MFKPFVLTGLGMVSAFGSGMDAFIKGVRNKSSGLAVSDRESLNLLCQELVGEIKAFDPKKSIGLSKIRAFDRLSLILMDAIEELLRSSKLKNGVEQWNTYTPEEVGAVVATTGSIATMCTIDLQTLEDARYIVPSDFPNAVVCAQIGHSSIRHGIKAFNYTITNGATGSADALLLTSLMLDSKKARLVIAGGAEELSAPYCIIMKKVAEKRNLPIVSIGEGAAVFTCESQENAQKRDATIYAEVLGVTSCFENNYSNAIKRNLSNLVSITGNKEINSIHHVFTSGIDESNLSKNEQINYDIIPTCGYLNNASTAFKISMALALTEIPCGELVLINDAENGGQFVSTVIRKVKNTPLIGG